MVEAGILSEDDRVELVDGNIIAMSPQNSGHYLSLRLVTKALERVFSVGYDVRAQGPLVAGEASIPEPDVAVVEGSPRDYLESHPACAILVVEISDSSLRLDRTSKLSVYARAGIPEYWIVDLEGRKMEVHREPVGNRYRTRTLYGEQEQVSPLGSPDAVIHVKDLLP